MGGEQANFVFRAETRRTGDVHVLVFQVNFPGSNRCQILHGADTWCLLLPRILKSSVGMLYGLFRIDFHALKLCGGN